MNYVNQTNTSWDDIKTALLCELWLAGRTASQIKDQLGLATRNQVIGKLSRLGMTRDVRKEERVQTVARVLERKTVARKTKVRAAPPKTDLSETALHLSLVELTDKQCRFPYGDSPFTFCGHATEDGSTYCPGHHAMCWTAPKERK